jgi:hypothetical protein
LHKQTEFAWTLRPRPLQVWSSRALVNQRNRIARRNIGERSGDTGA